MSKNEQRCDLKHREKLPKSSSDYSPTDTHKTVHESKSPSFMTDGQALVSSAQAVECIHNENKQTEARGLVRKWRKSQEQMCNEFYCLSLQWLSLPLNPSCPFTLAASPAKASNLKSRNVLSATFFSNLPERQHGWKQREGKGSEGWAASNKQPWSKPSWLWSKS